MGRAGSQRWWVHSSSCTCCSSRTSRSSAPLVTFRFPATTVVLVGDAIGLMVALLILRRDFSAGSRFLAGAAMVALAYLLRKVDRRQRMSSSGT